MQITARRATATFFFLQGLCASTFIARIPELRAHLHLTDARLGLATGMMAFGGLVMLPLAGMALTRFRVQLLLPLAALAHLLVLAGVGQVHSWPWLVASLIAFGMANTAVQLSVNAQAIFVERAQGRSLMAQFHGLWSVAGFVGALLGTAALALGISRAHHFVAVTVLGLVALILCLRPLALVHAGPAPAREALNWRAQRPEPLLVRLALLSFCAMFCESAMFDWSGVYYSQLITDDPLWVGLSYSVFMAAMASGRFVADRFVSRFGVERVLPLGGQLVAAGYLLCAALPYWGTTLLGFALTGLGVCAMVPLIMAQTARAKRTPLGIALAFVSVVGFIGAFLGPLLVGFVAEYLHLRFAFGAVGCVGLGIALWAGRAVAPPVRAARAHFVSAH